MSFRLIFGSAAIALVVVAGALLYTVAGYFAAEEGRFARDASAAADAVSAALERPAVEISHAISDSTLTRFADVERRVDAWAAPARARAVIRDVHVFSVDEGAFIGAGEEADPSLARWTEVFEKASEDVRVLSAIPVPLDAAQPALVAPVIVLQPPSGGLGGSNLVGFALVRFDAEALVQDYLREALRGRVDLDATFEVRVRPRAADWDGAWRPDATRDVSVSRQGAIALLAAPPAGEILSSDGDLPWEALP